MTVLQLNSYTLPVTFVTEVIYLYLKREYLINPPSVRSQFHRRDEILPWVPGSETEGHRDFRTVTK